jgi:solute:Na+ symporter, SSS family
LTASPVDLAILAAYLAATVLVGISLGRGQRGVADYMLGRRDVPWWAVLLSIVATETSTVTFLSIPGFAFAHDLTWLQLALGFVLARFVVRALLLPRFFQGSLFTAYEVLGRRFGSATRRLASLLFVTTRTLADGLRLYLTALVLQEVLGLGLPAAVLLVGLTTLAYTAIGGMRAVIWTDAAQFLVYVAGGCAALAVVASRAPGGAEGLLSAASSAGKLRVFDATLSWSSPYTLWAGLVGGLFLNLGSHGADQLLVQRYLCARSERDAGTALWASGFVVLAQFALFLLIGTALWGYYAAFPPAVPFDRPDRVFVHFIATEMPHGLTGLVLGAVFAAAMSTLSGSFNSSATAAANDLVGPWVADDAKPGRALRLTRALTVLFGVLQMTVALEAPRLTESVVTNVLTIAGFTTGIVLGVFLLGVLTRVGQRSALAGMAGGLVAMTALAFLTPLAWPWYSMVGSLGTLALGLAASRLWREPETGLSTAAPRDART